MCVISVLAVCIQCTPTHHAEMAGLNAVARTVVRLLFGASLMAGSYHAALGHYRTATDLAPRTLAHRVELGRTLAKVRMSDCRAGDGEGVGGRMILHCA
jgi:succinate dehydrogenase hydrophobic anchor subunit